ncbi:MAG: hypothetical protein ACRD8O_00160 [Bryobacteraceae bacterium]
MQCPRCKQSFPNDDAACPTCGLAVAGVVKSSAVLISTAEGEEVYDSVEEVPEDLRQTLANLSKGGLWETFIIADKRGRREIARFLRSLPGEPLAPAVADQIEREPEPQRRAGRGWLRWLGLLLVVAAAAVVWWQFSR